MVEVLLAVGLLATAVLTVMALFSVGIKLSSQNRDSITATQLGSSLLEKLVSGTVPLPTAAGVFDGAVPQAPVAGFPPAPYPKQSIDNTEYSFWVSSEPASGVANVSLVVVEVRWHGDKKIRLQALYYRP